LAIRVGVEQRQNQEHGGESQAIDRQKYAQLIEGQRSGGEGAREEKLERKDKEQHDEQQRRIEPTGQPILQRVAAEEDRALIPQKNDDREPEGKGKKSAQRRQQFVERLWPFERHHQESVRAKAKTASLNPSIRETSFPRRLHCSGFCVVSS
jgi:hypothetical protein